MQPGSVHEPNKQVARASTQTTNSLGSVCVDQRKRTLSCNPRTKRQLKTSSSVTRTYLLFIQDGEMEYMAVREPEREAPGAQSHNQCQVLQPGYMFKGLVLTRPTDRIYWTTIVSVVFKQYMAHHADSLVKLMKTQQLFTTAFLDWRT